MKKVIYQSAKALDGEGMTTQERKEQKDKVKAS